MLQALLASTLHLAVLLLTIIEDGCLLNRRVSGADTESGMERSGPSRSGGEKILSSDPFIIANEAMPR